MTCLEKTGKTVDEAIQEALDELHATREEVTIEIVEEPTKGLFGFIGNKMAKVIVREKPDPVKTAKEFLQQVFAAMGITVSLETMTDEDHVTLNLRGDDLGLLIGKHGQTLDALQYLTNLAANKEVEERIRIILDVEDYRKRRAETLTRLANRLADKVRRRGEKIMLEPMSPHERKIIHMALQNSKYVTTYSEGEDPFRKVIIDICK